MGAQSGEKRRHQRFTMALPLEIWHQGQRFSIRGETSDVSASGFYYPTMMQMPRDVVVTAKIWFGEKSLHCNAAVRTSDPGVGNGIEFVDLDQPSRDAWMNFLGGLEPAQSPELASN